MRNERGFILATVILFLMILSVTAFFAAGMTRTDIQIVNNVQNEKEALAIAEAGVQEVLYRMSFVGTGAAGQPGPHPVTIGGNSINPSLAPRLPDRGGGSPYGIDAANTSSTAQILLNTAAPVAGTDSTTPTLQPVASRLPYSIPAAGAGALTMRWEVCAPNSTLPGCDPAKGFEHVRQLPLSSPRPVVRIVSTGQSGNASQTVTVLASDVVVPATGCGQGGLCGLGGGCNDGITMNGNTSVTAAGTIQINAGATATTSPPCEVAETGGNQSHITAAEINVSGTVDNGNYNPPANEGALPQADPLAELLPPCFGSITTNCEDKIVFVGGTFVVGTLPVQNTTNFPGNPALANCTGTRDVPDPNSCVVTGGTLNPGIYYGGIIINGPVTMAPGVYVMAGGGIVMNNGNSTTTANGVTIYNTQNDDPCCRTGAHSEGGFGSFDLGTGNATVSFNAPTSGPYEGISLFQDRANPTTVDLVGGNSGNYTLSGMIYAFLAGVDLQGHTNQVLSGGIIANGPFELGGGSNITIGNATIPCPACAGGGGVRYVPIAWQDF